MLPTIQKAQIYNINSAEEEQRIVTCQVRWRTKTINKAEVGIENREPVEIERIEMEEYRLTEKIEEEIYMGEGIKMVFPIVLALFWFSKEKK